MQTNTIIFADKLRWLFLLQHSCYLEYILILVVAFRLCMHWASTINLMTTAICYYLNQEKSFPLHLMCSII